MKDVRSSVREAWETERERKRERQLFPRASPQ